MKAATKLGVPALAALAVTGTLVAVWPAAHHTDGTAAAPRSHAAGQEPVAKAQVGDPENPATWKLPIEAYTATKAEHRLVSSARDNVIKECMSTAGFPGWSPAPDLPTVGGTTLTDWRYGIHDLEQARQFGYHPDPEQQDAYDVALAADQSGEADQGVLEGCASQAGSTAGNLQQSALVEQISGDAYHQSMDTPEVKSVFAKWSACMKDKGYTYSVPLDASDDARFATGADEISQAEKDTSVADVACRDKYHVEKVWFDAEAAIQTKSIAKRLGELNQEKAAVKSAVAKARSVN
ncbi:hypothetical protein [Streptomyces sp. NPDC051677]|uniref:hypothetical protein n=1 Tax=Streptomyces sp. NPDC051677 TaxID=3365669 RepID=UPI0037D30AB7